MSQFERFVTEGSEKADELAKAGAMLDEGFMTEVRVDTVKQGREEVYVGLAKSQLLLPGSTMEGLRRAQAKTERKVDFR